MTLASPAPDVVVIQVDVLEAALANLKITGITAARLLAAVEKERNPSPTPSEPGPEQIKALLELMKSPPQDQHRSIPPYESTFTKEPVKGSDDADKVRRLKLRDLARKDLPRGEIPDPYSTAWLNLFDGAATRDLPYI